MFLKRPIFLHACALCVKLASSIRTRSITYCAPALAYLWFSILRNDANLFLYTLGGEIKREKCKQNSFFLKKAFNNLVITLDNLTRNSFFVNLKMKKKCIPEFRFQNLYQRHAPNEGIILYIIIFVY